MKNLFASCAVIALLASPALAQGTYEPTDPLVETEQSLDPTQRDQTTIPERFEPTVPETAPEQSQAAPDQRSENTPVPNERAAADPAGPGMTDTAEQQETDPDAAVAAASEAETRSEQFTEVAPFSPSIDLASLPDDYSTEDLNALMLAQLNVRATEIASFTAAFPAAAYAETQSPDTTTSSGDYASTGTSTSTQTAPSADGSMPADSYAAPETYSSTDPGTGSATGSSDESRMATDQGVSSESYSSAGASPSTQTNPAAEPDASAAPNAASDTSASSETDPAYAANPSPDSSMAPDGSGSSESYASTESAEPTIDREYGAMASSSGTMAEGDNDQNAVEIAAGDSRFTTLVELVGIAGLESALSAEGPYTVFAPTNEAFAALPEETVARLKAPEGQAELSEILKAHVVEGAILAGDVPMAGQLRQTVNDQAVTVTSRTDGTLNVAGSNTIGEGIYASNGVVYAVDAVILPEAVPPSSDTP